ncbi:MAG: hypothetical protein HY926_10515 [Elusimicrobia bacterium]|nr:hypothetical protein [Elusimicrobiota bacterium]
MAEEPFVFTRRHEDASSEGVYQFRFFCDRCGGGWLSPPESFSLGAAERLFREAGQVFGRVMEDAEAPGELRRAAAGPGRERAFQRAVEQGKTQLKKCPGCGQWVCPESCWDAGQGKCRGCAPVAPAGGGGAVP